MRVLFQSIRALGTMGDAAVLAEARRRFARLDSDPRALDGPAKGLWLDIVATNATAADWDKLHRLAQASKSSVERSMLYTLLGTAKDDALAQRALALSLTDEPGKTTSAARSEEQPSELQSLMRSSYAV